MTIQTIYAETGAPRSADSATSRDTSRYMRCIEASKRVRWDIDQVIQERQFDTAQNFLPEGFTKSEGFRSLSADEMRFMSQIQGRTYANMFGLLERFVNAKVLEVSSDHWLGDQVKLEALVRFSDEEIKHQELFRRIEKLIEVAMPSGYEFTPAPNPVAELILSKSTWAVLGLTLMVELVTQAHYRESIARDENLSPLYKDVFHYHWMEESQHAILDELEWRREDANLSETERDKAVDELIELAGAVDGILQNQAVVDTNYFVASVGRPVNAAESRAIHDNVLKAYRWQYIFSGAENSRFLQVISELVTDAQMLRIDEALQTLN